GGEAVQTTAPDPLAFKEIALRGLIHPPFLRKGGDQRAELARASSPFACEGGSRGMAFARQRLSFTYCVNSSWMRRYSSYQSSACSNAWRSIGYSDIQIVLVQFDEALVEADGVARHHVVVDEAVVHQQRIGEVLR